MDEITMLKTAGLSTSGIAIILIVYRVLKTMKGKRFVSSCCGKKLEMGIDVEEMTPKQIVIHNPMPKLSECLTDKPQPSNLDCLSYPSNVQKKTENPSSESHPTSLP
jgi:hypothetical protein